MSQASANPLITPAAGYRMNSPLLFDYLRHLPEDGYYQFLDVTTASPGLLDFFARFHCRLYLPGCVDELWRMHTGELDTPEKVYSALSKTVLLEGERPAKLDVILLWDLINYLQKPILSSLIEYLLATSTPDTVIHSYVYTRQSMPAAPGRYQFTLDNDILAQTRTTQTIACPAYYQEVLHKLINPFVVQRSILLSSGLQEYIFHLPRNRPGFF